MWVHQPQLHDLQFSSLGQVCTSRLPSSTELSDSVQVQITWREVRLAMLGVMPQALDSDDELATRVVREERLGGRKDLRFDS